MSPVILALQREPSTDVRVLATAQHREMLDPILTFFGIEPDIDLDQIRLPGADLNALAYFSRDLRELEASILLVEGPGTISSGPTKVIVVQTSVSEDEIRSFVTIFRRLYMAKEPGNFLKASDAFARAALPHPVGKWVQGVAVEYEETLDSVPDLIPFAPRGTASFTRKRLIDVFLYTQYAHQGDQRRERQYAECHRQTGITSIIQMIKLN